MSELRIRHICHAAFEIITEKGVILIDPFIQMNPSYDYHKSKIIDIFVTHGHGDHVGQGVEIAKETGCRVTSIVDVGQYFHENGVENVRACGVGAWQNYEWGRAILLPAIHSSTLPNGKPGGIATSILFEIAGHRIYHAGDTSLTYEFKGIKEVYHPDVALLPIGGYYVMDIEHAVIAVDWLGVKTVVPMHYRMLPVIDVDPQDFAKALKEKGYEDVKCVILEGEDELKLE